MGGEVERIPHRPGVDDGAQLGDLLIGRIEGPADGPRVLMVGHTDTVFSEGAAAERPFTIDDGRAYGPGACDMKSGLLAGFFAVDLLRVAGELPGSVTYVCNPDEEIGSTFSRSFIRSEAERADVAFVLEPARFGGKVVTARKGVTDLRIAISGRAAHAGVEPHKGASAVLEAAHKVVALHALNERWPGVTVNVGVISGGTRPNVVAERTELHVDIRAPEEQTLEQAERAALVIAESSTVPGTVAVVRMGSNHRPMVRSDGIANLFDLARSIGRELGFEVEETATGGGSDANTTAATGTPTLDGLGPIGGDAHTPAEWIEIESVVPRTALLAGLIVRADRVASVTRTDGKEVTWS
jgi:glutamate carboxypeptidase